VPGCETIERVSDTEYAVQMTARVGPVSAKFKGKLTLSDLKPPHSYSLAFDGQGGVAGFGKGSAQVRLEPENGATKLSYKVHASVGGKLAQIGSRLVDAAAKKLADDFFAAFNEKFAGGAEAHAAHATAPVPRETGLPSVSDAALRWLAGGALAAVLLGLYLLLR
jgi:hypothetical protein